MMSHSHLCPKSSHGHQRHLHTSFFTFLIVGSGALLVVVDRPWNIRVLLGPFRVKLLEWWKHSLRELATAVQSVQAQLMASEAARSNLQAQVERLGRASGERKIGVDTEPREAFSVQWHRQRLAGLVSCLSQLRCTGASGTEGRDAASGETVNCRNQCGTYRN